jgi:hypothetical protein
VKKLSYLLVSLTISAFIISNAYSQESTIAKTLPKVAGGSPSVSKSVSVERIEQDIAEALSVIESNHVVGKKINYNDVIKASIDGILIRITLTPKNLSSSGPTRVRATTASARPSAI